MRKTQHEHEVHAAAPVVARPPEQDALLQRAPADLPALAAAADPPTRARVGLELQMQLGNAGVQRLARRLAVAREPNAPAPPAPAAPAANAAFQSVDEVVSALAAESEDETKYKFETHQKAFVFFDKAGHDQLQNGFLRLQQRGGFTRLVEWVDFAQDISVERLRVALFAWRDRKRTSRAMFEIEHEADLAKLKPLDHDGFLEWIGLEDPVVAQLKATAGFQALDKAEQSRLLVYIGGGTSMSSGASGEMTKLLGDAKKDKSQPATFRAFLHAQAGLAKGVGAIARPRLETINELSAGVDVKGFKFRSGVADAVRYDATVGVIDPVTIAIYEPKVPVPANGVLPSVAEVVQTLATAQEATRKLVKEVHLNPGRNPDDKMWEKKKNMTGFRSFMTAGADGIVDMYPGTAAADGDKRRKSLEHESGHVASMKAWGGDENGPKWAPWRKAMKDDGFAASAYGKTGILDDFAEAWAMYMEAKGTPYEAELKTLMPARYAILTTFT